VIGSYTLTSMTWGTHHHTHTQLTSSKQPNCPHNRPHNTSHTWGLSELNAWHLRPLWEFAKPASATLLQPPVAAVALDLGDHECIGFVEELHSNKIPSRGSGCNACPSLLNIISGLPPCCGGLWVQINDLAVQLTLMCNNGYYSNGH
jgi:hypothetical protein